jgi:hypothetical protein
VAENDNDKRVDYSGLIIGLILAPVLILFIHFGKGEIGRAVCIDLAAILVAIRLRWHLKKHFWFWGIIVVLLALHVPLLLFIPWPSGWFPAVVALPFAVVDCLIVLWAVQFVGRFILKTPSSDEEA